MTGKNLKSSLRKAMARMRLFLGGALHGPVRVARSLRKECSHELS